jgi:phospholipid-translocating ATPase
MSTKVEIELETKGAGASAASAMPNGGFRVVHAQDRLKNQRLKYPPNVVSNTKYSVLTFLPKNLFEQFSLNINRYFLIIAILQLFAVLTPVNPLSTWGPLIVIFFISAAKEANDDWNRYKEDKAANERPVTVYRNTAAGYAKQEVQSQHIEVGDIVYLREDEQVPCDLLLLKSSGADGSCFITTTNLDGETNLKPRQAPAATRDKPEEEIWAFRGMLSYLLSHPVLCASNA